MFPKQRRQHHPVLSAKTQKLLWSQVVRDAVTHNGYEVDVKIKVLLWLNEGHDDLLLDFADDLSATVYADREKHFLMHQLAALIRKFPLLSTAYDPEAMCRKTLASTEWRTKWQNRRMKAARKRPSHFDGPVHYARNFIIKVLSRGEKYDETGFRDPTPNLNKILKSCTLTSGSAVGVHGNATNVLRKLNASWSCTPSCLNLALSAVAHNEILVEMLLSNDREQYFCLDPDVFRSRFADKVVLVDANIGGSVVKTAKTHRGIAVEPLLNLFVQTGINAVLRTKLKSVGLDLSTQEVNRSIALHASFNDDPDGYCTIDLSSASDTLATEVVRELLPEDWFELLDKSRTNSTVFTGEDRPAATERFCSMGNGFCFPLQTLIYASLVYASALQEGYEHPYDFSVYGDDIIVRKAIFERVIENLMIFGFSPNRRKTFSDGPFRESCGVDAYCGTDVRPIFCDGFDTISKVYNLHNQSIRRTYASTYFKEVRENLMKWVKRYMPEYYLVSPYDPTVRIDHEERVDGAFWVPFDVAISHRHARYHIDTWSWSFKLLYPEVDMDRAEPHAAHHPVVVAALRWAALTGGSSVAPFVKRYSQKFKFKRFWGPSGWLPAGV